MAKPNTQANVAPRVDITQSVSAQIRKLRADYPEMSMYKMSQVLSKANGKFIRPQWVRNVLVTPIKK